MGAWCFDLLIPELKARGHQAIAVDLPAGDPAAGTREYAEVVIDSLSAVAGPVIVVGHSLGGLTIPLVAQARPVERLVFLCAALPEPGRSHHEVKAEEPGEAVGAFAQTIWAAPGESHLATPEVAREMFFHDCAPDVQDWALARMRRQQRRPLREITPLLSWPPTPRSHLAATEDRCIPLPAARRTAWRLFGERPAELPGGHFLFLSRPAAVADALSALAR